MILVVANSCTTVSPFHMSTLASLVRPILRFSLFSFLYYSPLYRIINNLLPSLSLILQLKSWSADSCAFDRGNVRHRGLIFTQNHHHDTRLNLPRPLLLGGGRISDQLGDSRGNAQVILIYFWQEQCLSTRWTPTAGMRLSAIEFSILLVSFLQCYAQGARKLGRWVDTWSSMPQLTEPDNLPPGPFVRSSPANVLV